MAESPHLRSARVDIWSLQYLRAVAAIGVVIYHQLERDFFLAPLGEMGVDIFFVISGFIMFALTERRPITPGAFLIDRVTRIVPLYWIATFASLAIVLTGHTINGAAADPLLLITSLFFVPMHNAAGELYPMVPQGWSLNYEMFFYLLFALALLLPRERRLTAMTALFLLLIGAGFVLHPTSAAGIDYSSPLIVEFLAGAWLGKLFGTTLDRKPLHITVASALMLVALLSALGTIDPVARYGGYAVLIVAGALVAERRRLVPRVNLLKLLGNASYAIYLFQEIAFEAVRFTFTRISIPAHLGVDGVLSAKIASVIAAIVLGIVINLTIEGPLTRGFRRFFSRPPAQPAGQPA